ncbi:MAG: SDR family oxidoreductase [bacterium]|nr:SDR family oxidoreductase [bacterium]
MIRKFSETALITGASSGIGRAFTEQLAAQGINLILVARRQELLENLALEVRERHEIEAEVMVADLATEQGLLHVEQCITQANNLMYLINNAGFGTPGLFTAIPLEKSLGMLRVHVEATTRFCWAALQEMVERNRGNIINVSSLAAFLPYPSAVTYCATKTYINTFSVALQKQLRYTGINVQALCPGYTYSDFHDTEEYADFSRSKIPKWLWMTSEEVASRSLRALHRKSVIVVPSLLYRVVLTLMRNSLTGIALRMIDEMFHPGQRLPSSQ